MSSSSELSYRLGGWGTNSDEEEEEGEEEEVENRIYNAAVGRVCKFCSPSSSILSNFLSHNFKQLLTGSGVLFSFHFFYRFILEPTIFFFCRAEASLRILQSLDNNNHPRTLSSCRSNFLLCGCKWLCSALLSAQSPPIHRTRTPSSNPSLGAHGI